MVMGRDESVQGARARSVTKRLIPTLALRRQSSKRAANAHGVNLFSSYKDPSISPISKQNVCILVATAALR